MPAGAYCFQEVFPLNNKSLAHSPPLHSNTESQVSAD